MPTVSVQNRNQDETIMNAEGECVTVRDSRCVTGLDNLLKTDTKSRRNDGEKVSLVLEQLTNEWG